ncbi:SGNH/GDSL hydrolase family protein [Streptomyces sp. NPDC052396]|uniref:SGNH/GDSL hydrolase family protein n=1 Tax=Streptomyces sp. NPDC052396 TaxID=3365689 RepID=UPI0037CCE1B1
MRRRLLAALLCPWFLVTAGTPAAASAGPAAVSIRHRVSYAALGDSVASGQGAGRYDPDSRRCLRSSGAHPALWAAGHHPARFVFAACSGAKTSDVVKSQLDAVDSQVTLVSVTVGANDVGFADVMTTCTLGNEQSCLDQVARAEKAVQRTLPGRLDAVYRAIKGRAGRARVVALGLPRLFGPEGCRVGLMTKRGERALNRAADHLNAVTRGRAHAHGLVFGDVAPAFARHGICSEDPWINAPSLLHMDGAYHPNAEGQRLGYLPVLAAAARS